MQEKSLLATPSKIHNIACKAMALAALLSGGIAMFGGMGLTPSYIVAALVPLGLLLVSGWQNRTDLKERSKNMSALMQILAVFFVYALASCAWSINPPQALHLWSRLLFFFIASIAVFHMVQTFSQSQKDTLLWTLTAGTLLAIAIAAVEIFSNGLLNRLAKPGQDDFVFELVRLNRASAYLSVLIWPLVAFFIAQKKPLWLVATSILTALTISSLESQTAVMALIAGGVVFAAVYAGRQKAINAVIIIAMAGIFAVPLVAKNIDPQAIFKKLPNIPAAAMEYRLEIWHFTANKAASKPWLGWGFNSARNMPVERHEYVSNDRHPIPLHPHNNVLHVWLELGVIGLALWALAIGALLHQVKSWKTTRTGHAASTAAITAYFTAGLTGFGVWQNWWIATGLLAALFLTATLHKNSSSES